MRLMCEVKVVVFLVAFFFLAFCPKSPPPPPPTAGARRQSPQAEKQHGGDETPLPSPAKLFLPFVFKKKASGREVGENVPFTCGLFDKAFKS